jgi:putative lipoprotein
MPFMRPFPLLVAALGLAACQRVDEPAAPAPDFVAIGQEPGWRIQVAQGQAPAMHALLDYGERKFDVADVVATANGWSGVAPDGAAVALAYERIPCQDSMSGEPFELTATLTVGDRTYRGCGRFSAD